MNQGNGAAALIGFSLGVAGYYVLATWLVGGVSSVGFVAAVVFSLIGIAGAGTLAEAVPVAVILSVLVALVFGIGAPPPTLFGHIGLAVASGLTFGMIGGSVAFGSSAADPCVIERPAADPSVVEGSPTPPSVADHGSEGPFDMLDSVEFARMTLADRWWTEGAEEIARAPRVGDRGLIMNIEKDARGLIYTVEVLDSDSNTICVTEALTDELVMI